MYTSFDELWQGWGKNLYRAAADSPAKMVTILLAFSLAYLAPEALLAVSAISLFFAPTPFAVAAVLASGAVAAWGHLMRIRKYRAMRWPLRYEWGHSLATEVALLLLVSSFVSDRRKSGIVWKGRTYDGGRLDS